MGTLVLTLIFHGPVRTLSERFKTKTFFAVVLGLQVIFSLSLTIWINSLLLSSSQVLSKFARHWQTGEVLPEEQINNLCMSKKMFAASVSSYPTSINCQLPLAFYIILST